MLVDRRRSVAAVGALIAHRAGLAALVVDEERLAGHVERGVGEHVLTGPLDHDAVGGEEEDGVLGGTPRSVIHRSFDAEGAVGVTAAAVDHLGGRRHLGTGAGHLALHRVVAHQLALRAEQVDVAQLVRVGVALEPLGKVLPLEPAAGLHGLHGVRHGLDGRAGVLLGLRLALVLRRTLLGSGVGASRHERHDGEQRDEPQELLLGLRVGLHVCWYLFRDWVGFA